MYNMGQYFVILNIDRNYRIHFHTFGEDYRGSPLAHCLNLNSWAGDRLILLGDYTEDFPAGIKQIGDSEEAFEYRDRQGNGVRGGYSCDSSYSETSILRNLCSREYIKAELFPCKSGPCFSLFTANRIISS